MFTIDVKTSTIYASIISPPTFNTILIRFDSFRQLIREKKRSFLDFGPSGKVRPGERRGSSWCRCCRPQARALTSLRRSR